MAICMLCGKHTSFGRSISKSNFARKRTLRTFKPNLQHATIMLDGQNMKVTACTRCLRTANKANKIRQ